MLTALLALLIVLKLASVVDWSWWIVLIPLYFIVGRIVLVPVWLFVWAFIVALVGGNRRW